MRRVAELPVEPLCRRLVLADGSLHREPVPEALFGGRLDLAAQSPLHELVLRRQTVDPEAMRVFRKGGEEPTSIRNVRLTIDKGD